MVLESIIDYSTVHHRVRTRRGVLARGRVDAKSLIRTVAALLRFIFALECR